MTLNVELSVEIRKGKRSVKHEKDLVSVYIYLSKNWCVCPLPRGQWEVCWQRVSAVTFEQPVYQYFSPSVTLSYCVVINLNSDKALTMSTQ